MIRTTAISIILILLSSIYCEAMTNTSLFRQEHIIFSTGHNITSLLVPAYHTKHKSLQRDNPTVRPIFFTIEHPKFDGGHCIYVLEGVAAYEILEGGRDSTVDYNKDKTVYFGGKDGLYEYVPETFSVAKYGTFADDIIQLQKATDVDKIYILTSDNKFYEITKKGTVKTKIHIILCALQFVLDTSNNIYYIDCQDNKPHIVLYDGSLSIAARIYRKFKDIKLIRPAFTMENSVPFFGDGNLYLLYSNGTCEMKDVYLNVMPSAFSVDAALYLLAAVNGKIYEFNVMEALMKTMFGSNNQWPREMTQTIVSIIDSARDSIYSYYSGWQPPMVKDIL